MIDELTAFNVKLWSRAIARRAEYLSKVRLDDLPKFTTDIGAIIAAFHNEEKDKKCSPS